MTASVMTGYPGHAGCAVAGCGPRETLGVCGRRNKWVGGDDEQFLAGAQE